MKTNKKKFIQQEEGAKFVNYFGPILDALRDLGGSGTPGEVINKVAENLKVPESELNEILGSGQRRFNNQVQWGRQYLVWEGLVSSSVRGVWSLTKKGENKRLTPQEAREIFLNRVKRYQEERKNKKAHESDQVLVSEAIRNVGGIEDADDESSHKEKLLRLLKQIPASGFEKLAQQLLRESDFEEVVVLGRSGDGGIDGHGILRVNPFVSFVVLFQCKRYAKEKSVTASHVRDFRGAMQGKADKGIIITTGSFTSDAEKEAKRDGAPPIELVDGVKLIELFEKLEMGLKPITAYEIDEEFFRKFE